MSQIEVSIIVVILGEGGSGGALGIALGDYVLMFENAIYSVITPEGCAAILWKSNDKSSEAAAALGLNAEELGKNGIIDEIIPEREPWKVRTQKTVADEEANLFEPPEITVNLKQILELKLEEFEKIESSELVRRRFIKFKKMGFFNS